MGGKGSGGRRINAGRKPKTARVLTHPSAPADRRVSDVMPEPVDEFDAPNDLTLEERQVWLELAPHAFRRRTLTRATEAAFKVLCRNVVLERAFRTSLNDRGTGNHRGMIRLVEIGLDAFGLRPQGKPLYEEAAKPSTADQKASYW